MREFPVFSNKPSPAMVALLSLALLLLTGVTAAEAQRQRSLPPEPSREAWVSVSAIDRLSRAIDRYRDIVAAGGWPTLPDRITLRLGDSGTHIATLRRRLEINGDVRPGGDRYQFDSVLEAGVKRYQIRNGLEPTGIVYGITQRALNVPAETRLRQLELNLTRMQDWLPRALAPRVILMNSASFELQAIANGRVEVTSRTVAGKRATPTPVVSSAIRAINLLPYWHVPTSIARAALIPAIRKDPSYLYREHIRVFSSFGGEEIDPAVVNWWGPEANRYVFRQDPGPHNALGLLRFDMPNKHIVYLHDTPMQSLFRSFERAYSAGCVRTENYLEVAAWILAGEGGWTRQALEDAIAASQRKTIKVSQPVPVHFIYLTAWEENGTVQFRNDLYNLDDGAQDSGGDASASVMSMPVAP
ncbi:L,D-transpeptidase family protein [Hyphomicrobium sp.]|uniref:L,D-transpeptidase family protein n=1 Tax=Hyphomicrobium sp. TaxID=82 RepID=UPI002FDE6997